MKSSDQPSASANVSCVCCFTRSTVAVIVADRRMRQPLAAVTSPLAAPCYCRARPGSAPQESHCALPLPCQHLVSHNGKNYRDL